jgi:hypothetical protein
VEADNLSLQRANWKHDRPTLIDVATLLTADTPIGGNSAHVALSVDLEYNRY